MTSAEEQAAADAAAADKAAAEAQAANDAANAAAAGGSGGKTVAGLEAELARTAEALRIANSDDTKRRHKLAALEKAEAEREAASLSELEKANKRAVEAEAREKAANERTRETALKTAFEVAAYKAGVAHPEDVYLLADKSSVSMDDDGKIAGVAEAVKALVDAGRLPMSDRRLAPGLDGGAGGGNGGGHGSAVKLTADEIEMARKMGVSPERAAAQKAAMLKEQAV